MARGPLARLAHRLALVFGISNMAMGSFMVLGPVIVDRELGGAAEWGFIMTVGALGAIVGGAVALRWKPARPLAVGFALMLVGATRTLSLIPPLPVLVIAIAAMATLVAISISNTLWETVLQQRIPQASLSRVSSYDWMVSLAFQPIAYVIIGPLADTIGEVPTLLLASAIGWPPTSAPSSSRASGTCAGWRMMPRQSQPNVPQPTTGGPFRDRHSRQSTGGAMTWDRPSAAKPVLSALCGGWSSTSEGSDGLPVGHHQPQARPRICKRCGLVLQFSAGRGIFDFD